jgi:hypothetical protein
MQSFQAAPGGGGVVIAVVLNLIRTKSPLMQSDKGEFIPPHAVQLLGEGAANPCLID